MDDTIARRIATALGRIATALEKLAGIEPPAEDDAPERDYVKDGVDSI